MRVTVRIEDIIGHSSSGNGKPWLWPVFFALDDTALAGLLGGRPQDDGVLRAHPPVPVASRAPTRGNARSSPPLALQAFDLDTQLIQGDSALVGVAALLERGNRPSEEARDAMDELVAGLRLTLAQRLGASLGLKNLLPVLAGGGITALGEADTPEDTFSLSELRRGTIPAPDAESLHDLTHGPLLRSIRIRVPESERQRALGFSMLTELMADPDFEVDRPYTRPPLVAGHHPDQLGVMPDVEHEEPSPDEPFTGRGSSVGDLSRLIGGGALRTDLRLRTGRLPSGLRHGGSFPGRAPPRIEIPVQPREPSGASDLPRRFNGVALDRALTLLELAPEAGTIIASGFAFWTLSDLTAEKGRRFRTRLHGERGARVSFVMRGALQVTPRSSGRPKGWSREGRGGSHLVVPAEDGSISVYLRGAGAAEHEAIALAPGASAVGRVAGGARGKQQLLAWRDSEGRIRSAGRAGSRPWSLRTIVRKNGATGDPTLLADPAGERWVLAYGARDGGVRVQLGTGKQWKATTLVKGGSEVERVSLATVPESEAFWAAWADKEGTPWMAVEAKSGSWKVSQVRGKASLPRVVGSPLALADPGGRLPALAYRATDGLVLLRPSRGRWEVDRPKLPGAPPPVGEVDAVTIPTWKSVALAFRSADGGIHLVLRNSHGAWRHEPLSRVPATPRGGSDPCLWVAGSALHLSWLDDRGNLWEASRSEDGSWRSADVGALADASEPAGARR